MADPAEQPESSSTRRRLSDSLRKHRRRSTCDSSQISRLITPEAPVPAPQESFTLENIKEKEKEERISAASDEEGSKKSLFRVTSFRSRRTTVKFNGPIEEKQSDATKSSLPAPNFPPPLFGVPTTRPHSSHANFPPPFLGASATSTSLSSPVNPTPLSPALSSSSSPSPLPAPLSPPSHLSSSSPAYGAPIPGPNTAAPISVVPEKKKKKGFFASLIPGSSSSPSSSSSSSSSSSASSSLSSASSSSSAPAQEHERKVRLSTSGPTPTITPLSQLSSPSSTPIHSPNVSSSVTPQPAFPPPVFPLGSLPAPSLPPPVLSASEPDGADLSVSGDGRNVDLSVSAPSSGESHGFKTAIPRLGGLSTSPVFRAGSRVSVRLEHSASNLSELLEKRPTPEQVQHLRVAAPLSDSQSSVEASSSSHTFRTWSSKFSIADDWPVTDLRGDPQFVEIISESCRESGYKIEYGQKEIKLNVPLREDDLRIFDSDSDFTFFFEFLYNKTKYSHFWGDNEELGPIIVTIEREKSKKFQKALIRSPKKDDRVLITCNSVDTKAQIKALQQQHPELSNYKLSKPEDEEEWSKALLQLEEKLKVSNYKFGVLYCKNGQIDEDDMLSNVETSPEFEEFLTLLGDKVPLLGWEKFRGGLRVQDTSTGTHSVYTEHKGFEIMYHVSSMLPFCEDDNQQLQRKRHIGNDVVVIIFKEDLRPFDPRCLRSQFNHVFLVVQPVGRNPDNGMMRYRMAMACKDGCYPCRPFLPFPPILEYGEDLKHFLRTKLINAERAAMYAPDFKSRLSRTRAMMLRDIIKSGKCL